MPRSSSPSRSYSSSRSSSYKSIVNYKPSPVLPYKPAPVPAKINPTPSQVVVHQPPTFQPPTLFDSMKQGFGFGMGSSIAHSIFGPSRVVENKTIIQKTEGPDANFCKDITEQLTKCKNDGYCTEEFMKTLEENLKKCNKPN